ncbi:MAG TPA: phage holin family protein [Dehalococcoidia bacterium]|jgi:putative membrane protein|nr:phage holin family protein [Dehalococcoidia bacterium]
MARVHYTYWEYSEPPWDYGEVPWLVRMAVRWAMTVAGFAAAAWVVNNVVWQADRWHETTAGLLLAALIYVVMRAVVRPVLIFLTCPLQLLTLGLFLFVVNALIVILTDWVCDWLGIDFAVDGFWAAFIGALVISFVTFVLSRVLHRNPLGPRPR